ALCLSGGGARGSFQMGAIEFLYEVFGYRPDFLATTSVGSVNGIKLAEGAPPATNDSATILSAVAAGVIDEQLTAMRGLKQIWLGIQGPSNFFVIRPPFVGTQIQKQIEE